MTEQDGEHLLRTYLAAGDARDWGALDDVLADDVVTRSPGGSVLHGRAAAVEAWRAGHAGLSRLRHDVLTVVAAGDHVAARVLVTGHHTGRFLGVEPTGARVAVDQAVFARIALGRVAEVWEVVDTGSGLQQLGVLGARPLAPGRD
ncbi:ester cyclase [Aquipuribacter sp. SD81]|uniref:ester cyclase n=1 Tax=Aquipuribacter sp. SD81 TaxID=3127703 RepID=UPI003019CD03